MHIEEKFSRIVLGEPVFIQSGQWTSQWKNSSVTGFSWTHCGQWLDTFVSLHLRIRCAAVEDMISLCADLTYHLQKQNYLLRNVRIKGKQQNVAQDH